MRPVSLVGLTIPLLALTLLGQPAWSAQSTRGATVIAFEGDSPGFQRDGFTSVDSSIAHFYDSEGQNLQVADFGNQSHGQAIAADYDDPSRLRIRFDQDICSISMAFGNDDPCCSNEGDQARLRLFLGRVRVADTAVTMNRNDIMDQTISIDSVTFNRAEFVYAVSTNGLIEVVDDITFTSC